jgi:hygromycin-B 7''-O-kinase
MNHPLAPLECLDGYRQHFMDPGLWRPYVIAACTRHGLTPCETISAGLPGTCPAFSVGGSWLIKFFGRLFDGAAAYAAEAEANRLLDRERVMPAPAVVAAGELFSASSAPGGWTWPYLIYEFVAGVSIGEVWEQMDEAEHLAVARSLGPILRRLHAVPLTGSPVFPDTWQTYKNFLATRAAHAVQAAQEWACLPDHLIAQIPSYILPPEMLVRDGVRPHLIHADLTGDHLLGRLKGGRWSTSGIIDFGDAMVGSIYYEVVALHLGLFRRDRQLLWAFLDAYGWPAEARHGFPARAMTSALLHRSNVLVDVPALDRAKSLEQLAENLWGPG